MPTLCDFNQIVGNQPITIGEPDRVWEKNFDAGGRTETVAFLIFNVKHLTHSNLNVPVSINGTQVGSIYPYRPGGSDIDMTDIKQVEKWRQADHWYTQMIAFSGSLLNSGTNTIQIQTIHIVGVLDCSGIG